jgi:hypothetical protein
MRKLFFVVLLLALFVNAGLSQKKTWNEWSKDEAEKILNDSPWGQTQTDTDVSEMVYTPTTLGSGSAARSSASRGARTPTQSNPLGVKGAGQAGCIAAPQTVMAAVLVWFYLWRTRWGYALRVFGHSEKAAVYGGIATTRTSESGSECSAVTRGPSPPRRREGRGRPGAGPAGRGALCPTSRASS